MTNAEEQRPGSPGDLSRRMDKLETKHDDLAREVGALTSTIARVELNQAHAEELARLRFGSLDQAVGQQTTKLDAFMSRIEGLMTGEIELPRQADLMRDWNEWRKSVEARLDTGDIFAAKGRVIGVIVLALPGVIALAFGAWQAIK